MCKYLVIFVAINLHQKILLLNHNFLLLLLPHIFVVIVGSFC
jgi:hypothetical protein